MAFSSSSIALASDTVASSSPVVNLTVSTAVQMGALSAVYSVATIAQLIANGTLSPWMSANACGLPAYAAIDPIIVGNYSSFFGVPRVPVSYAASAFNGSVTLHNLLLQNDGLDSREASALVVHPTQQRPLAAVLTNLMPQRVLPTGFVARSSPFSISLAAQCACTAVAAANGSAPGSVAFRTLVYTTLVSPLQLASTVLSVAGASVGGAAQSRPVSLLEPGAGYWTSAADLARFGAMLLNGGVDVPSGRRVLQAEAVALMLTPRFTNIPMYGSASTTNETLFNVLPASTYGFVRTMHNGQRVLLASAAVSNVGAAVLALFPDSNQGVVIVLSGTSPSAALAESLALLYATEVTFAAATPSCPTGAVADPLWGCLVPPSTIATALPALPSSVTLLVDLAGSFNVLPYEHTTWRLYQSFVSGRVVVSLTSATLNVSSGECFVPLNTTLLVPGSTQPLFYEGRVSASDGSCRVPYPFFAQRIRSVVELEFDHGYLIVGAGTVWEQTASATLLRWEAIFGIVLAVLIGTASIGVPVSSCCLCRTRKEMRYMAPLPQLQAPLVTGYLQPQQGLASAKGGADASRRKMPLRATPVPLTVAAMVVHAAAAVLLLTAIAVGMGCSSIDALSSSALAGVQAAFDLAIIACVLLVAHVVLAVLVCVLAQWQPIFKVWYTLGCGLLVVFVMLLLQWNWLGGNWVLVA